MAQLEVSRTGRVSILTLTRPEYGNRLSQEMAEQLTAALEAARRDPEIGACVITGHGGVFCLGGDYKGAGPTIAGRAEFGRASVDMYRAMAGLGKPLVAAVNGDAHAGGFSLVAAADLAVIADEPRFAARTALHAGDDRPPTAAAGALTRGRRRRTHPYRVVSTVPVEPKPSFCFVAAVRSNSRAPT